MLTMAAYAGEPCPEHPMIRATNVEIVKRTGVKGMSLTGPPARGPKPQATKGILGEEVTGGRYAVVVGISNYPGEETVLEGGFDLFYADDDARDVAEVLQGYEFDDVQLLVASEGEGESKVTRKDVIDAIDCARNMAGPGDEVVFYFSGHGAKYMGNPTLARGGGGVGVVTWADDGEGFGFIWDKDLKEEFSGFKTDRVVFIFDCCLAGGMIDLGDKGRVICMATTQAGIAVEYGEAYGPPIPGMGPVNHGLFTYYFVELGMVYGLADSYPLDGCITVEESFDFTRFCLEQISMGNEELWQIPTIKDGFKNDLLL